MVGGLTRLSPLVSTINTKISTVGHHLIYFKCMTKEEIIARKNADWRSGILKKYNPTLRFRNGREKQSLIKKRIKI